MKRLFQAVTAVFFGLVLGVFCAKLRLLIAEDSLSGLTAQALALDVSDELRKILIGFGALTASVWALVGLGCMPKTKRSPEQAASDELVANDVQETEQECCEKKSKTLDTRPKIGDGTASRSGLQSITALVRSCVKRQLNTLEPGLTEFVDPDGKRGAGYATPRGDIDILAEDAAGDLVAVKIALDDRPEALCSNMLAQIAWVRQHLAGVRRVRGIIVTPAVPEDLRYALSEVPAIQTYEYELQVNLRRQASPQVTPNVTMPQDILGSTTVSLVS